MSTGVLSVSIVDMHDQQVLPDATNLNTHLRIGNVRGEERPRKRPPSAHEILDIRVLVF